MKLAEMTLEEFADQLASGQPVPGGGSAAALQGAMGACLGAMVCALTVGRGRYAAHQDLAQTSQTQTNLLKTRFLAAMDEDAQAFGQVTAVFSMPRETEKEKESRREAMQHALKLSTKPPLAVMELCNQTLRFISGLVGNSNAGAVSDLGVAALCLKAGLQSAWLNVCINLASIQDEAFLTEHRQTGELLLKRGCTQADAIYEMVLGSL